MLDAKAVATLLAMHTNWVYAEAKAGSLPSYKIGGARRFRRSEIDDYLARHCRQPSGDV